MLDWRSLVTHLLGALLLATAALPPGWTLQSAGCGCSEQGAPCTTDCCDVPPRTGTPIERSGVEASSCCSTGDPTNAPTVMRSCPCGDHGAKRWSRARPLLGMVSHDPARPPVPRVVQAPMRSTTSPSDSPRDVELPPPRS